eukprot:5039832-Alexandrium_andersonii.AAC.1
MSRITDCRISRLRIAPRIASSREGSAPRTPEKRLRRARRPVPSPPSDSACKMFPNSPDEAL